MGGGLMWNFAHDLPFSFWSPPRFGEPAYGYFTRLVFEEYHKSATVYLDAVSDEGGYDYQERATEAVQRLPLPDVQKRSLATWTPRRIAKGWVLNQERLQPFNLRKKTRRFCPGCIAEDPYHRVWWDIVAFERCPFHDMPVRERMRDGTRYSWVWPDFAIDRLGDPCGVEREREPQTATFEHYLLERLGAAPSCGPRPLLDDASLAMVIGTCFHFGRILLNPWRETAPGRGKTWSAGYAAVKGTASELEAILIEWLLTNTDQELRNSGVDIAFGWARIGGRIKSQRLLPHLDDAMKRALARTGRVGRGSSSSVPAITHRELNLKELAVRYDIRVAGLRRILTAAGFPERDDTVGFHELYRFDQEWLGRMDAFVDGLATARETMAVLGCDRTFLDAAIRMGELVAYGALSQADDRWLIMRTTVESLKRKLDAIVPSGGVTGLGSFRTLCRRAGWTTEQMLSLVLSGELQVACLDPLKKGVHAWRFELNSPNRVRRGLHDKEMTRTEATILTSLGSATLNYLVERGVLELSQPGASTLNARSVHAFHRRYVKASLFYRELGATAPNRVWVACEKLGIKLPFRRSGRLSESIVAREDLKRVGVVERKPSPSAVSVWKEMLLEFKASGSPFHLPNEIKSYVQKMHPANRRCVFEVYADEDSVVVRKLFSAKFSREWRVLLTHRHLLVDDLKDFKWEEDAGEVTATIWVRTSSEIGAVRIAADTMYWHMRNLQ